MERVLIVDDDRELCELLTEYLAQEGFEVAAAFDGESGLERAREQDHDLIVLDVMLPRLNGFDVLRRLRAESSVPVIMLTARGDDVDRIVGLEIGADDYLPKPFNTRELVARIRSVLRRAYGPWQDGATPSEPIQVGEVELFPAAREVARGGEVVELTGVEYDLLHQLIERAGQVVSREEISEKTLNRPYDPIDRTIDMHISNLRRKLGRDGDGDRLIKTVRGTGYIFARRLSEG